ncbi:serine hydrolase domain-containing protein, partial [Algoriella sp.]|uniref:serine hydrolase domain-containing protein n=1 Tax=Algoriella sp. TaxID=1872434 RepID=UPI001B1EB7CB
MRKLLLTTFCTVGSLLFAQELNKPALDSLFTYMNKEKIGTGSVSIFKDGKEIYVNSYGNRDYENNLPNNAQTKFRIGSISKTFTATLIMKLIEDRKLTLDTKLSKFYPNIVNSDKITIQNLLQHSSGIQNITATPSYLEWYLKDISKPE